MRSARVSDPVAPRPKVSRPPSPHNPTQRHVTRPRVPQQPASRRRKTPMLRLPHQPLATRVVMQIIKLRPPECLSLELHRMPARLPKAPLPMRYGVRRRSPDLAATRNQREPPRGKPVASKIGGTREVETSVNLHGASPRPPRLATGCPRQFVWPGLEFCKDSSPGQTSRCLGRRGLLITGHIPDSQSISGAGEVLAIRTEGHAKDGIDMPFEGEGFLTRGGIP